VDCSPQPLKCKLLKVFSNCKATTKWKSKEAIFGESDDDHLYSHVANNNTLLCLMNLKEKYFNHVKLSFVNDSAINS
jgi:hypothetical protein